MSRVQSIAVLAPAAGFRQFLQQGPDCSGKLIHPSGTGAEGEGVGDGCLRLGIWDWGGRRSWQAARKEKAGVAQERLRAGEGHAVGIFFTPTPTALLC